jgi:hypothetical protein
MLLRQFQESTQRARDMAEHLPEAQAAEAAFYLERSMACRHAVHFVEQQYIRALLAARQGSTYLQQCVACSPTGMMPMLVWAPTSMSSPVSLVSGAAWYSN